VKGQCALSFIQNTRLLSPPGKFQLRLLRHRAVSLRSAARLSCNYYFFFRIPEEMRKKI